MWAKWVFIASIGAVLALRIHNRQVGS